MKRTNNNNNNNNNLKYSSENKNCMKILKIWVLKTVEITFSSKAEKLK